MRKILASLAVALVLGAPLVLEVGGTSADSGAALGNPAEAAVAAVAAGKGFHCWVESGAAKCIGSNAKGQLGDGTTTARTSAVTVVGLGSGVIAIAAGDAHVCALRSTGAMSCWGSNDRGQLGDGTTTDASSPVQVTGLTSGVVRIEAGFENSCAVTSAGEALCWGNNQTFGAGSVTADANADNIPDPVLVPTRVTGLASGVVAIAVNGERASATSSVAHGCAVLQYGELVCWGSNNNGQVGVAGAGPFDSPRQVAVGVQVSAIALGAIHSCALSVDGGVTCWGANNFGQLANGTTTAVTAGTLTPVSGAASGIVQISSGRYTSCALTNAGGLRCWGDNIHGGIESTPTRSSITSPVTPYSLSSGIAAVALGEYSTCIVLANRDLRCWGANDFGQTGDGHQTWSFTPVAVHSAAGNSTPLAGIQTLGSSLWGSCGVTASGGLKCWGYNFNYEIGDGTRVSAPHAVDNIHLPSGVQRVEGRHAGYCAVLTDTQAHCWGLNGNSRFGQGDSVASITPRPMLTGSPSTAVTGVTEVAVGQYHSCVVANGSAMCAGWNTSGALGDGTTNDSSVLVQVSGLTSGVSKIAVGGGFGSMFSCAVLTDGTVRCWGSDSNGQLGNGAGSSSTVPGAVSGITDAVDVVIGADYACALKSDGTVACWGRNSFGQLGNGSNTTSQVPVAVTGVSGATHVAAGDRTACAIVAGGAMKCWGWNYHGFFVDGTTTDSNVAVSAVGVSGLQELQVSSTHSCGLFAAGAVKCWGLEQSGQLGNGRMQNRGYTPHLTLATGLSSAATLPTLQVLAPTTTTIPSTTTTTTVSPAASSDPDATPSTESDPTRIDDTVYVSAPSRVGHNARLIIVRSADARRVSVASTTPRTCIAGGRSVITIAAGDCRVLVRSLSSGAVLKRWTTRVVTSDVGIGSTVRVAPSIVFPRASTRPMTSSLNAALAELKGARSVFVVGHSAFLTGKTPENRRLSLQRASRVGGIVARRAGVTSVDVVGVGGDAPVASALRESSQSKNRRVVVYYVP